MAADFYLARERDALAMVSSAACQAARVDAVGAGASTVNCWSEKSGQARSLNRLFAIGAWGVEAPGMPRERDAR